jgi:hypothetical protein
LQSLRFLAFQLGGPDRSRSSWDQTAVLVAVRGAEENFQEIRGHSIAYSGESGEHCWSRAGSGPDQIYLKQIASDESLASVIEELMSRPPPRG